LTNETEASPIEAVRAAAQSLARHRRRPCLAVIGEIDRQSVSTALSAIEPLKAPAIDLMVCGPGGNIEAAYLLVRTLRRRFRIDAAFVPHLAKSASTFLCLGADEIVLAELGELGPLDAQSAAGSALVPFKLVEQVSDAVAQGLRRNREALRAGPATPSSSADAAEIAGAIIRSAFSPVEAIRLAEAARALEETQDLCERLFRRYRHELYADGVGIVHKLIHGYPCHSFPIDLEELRDLGLPARQADDDERGILDAVAEAIATLLNEERRLIELALPKWAPAEEALGGNGHDPDAAAAA
jgi:hypothetical protein